MFKARRLVINNITYSVLTCYNRLFLITNEEQGNALHVPLLRMTYYNLVASILPLKEQGELDQRSIRTHTDVLQQCEVGRHVTVTIRPSNWA